MNEEESLALLRARISAPQSGEPGGEERALVQALECIPLATTQPAVYIANRLPPLTVSAYLRLFHESESKRTRLLQNEDSADLRRDPSIRYAVITTWHLSLEAPDRMCTSVLLEPVLLLLIATRSGRPSWFQSPITKSKVPSVSCSAVPVCIM
jgi:hypothetical protein